MARTHSSHTASPIRSRSPRRSPARLPSQDGSQYEMDLDALGLNSTFESTELDGNHEPPVDRVDTSEIEGPEDFTMNMTYWMTADLPLAQIKSRKEANARRSIVRMDAMRGKDEPQDTTQEGDQAIVEDTVSASPTVRANGTTADREYSTPASERSMENDEKVRSFLSALPDTDMEGALTGTPLHMPQQNLLQVPRSSPPKARSLQATVEDYDTPRKPTQETVIHHTLATVDTDERYDLQDQVAELQSRLEQHSLASKTRITELETILSYTRGELDRARTDNYRHQDKLAALEQSRKQQRAENENSRLSVEAQMKAREDALESKMREFGEEMRLQNLAKLQKQQTEFERQMRGLQEAQRVTDEEGKINRQKLEQAQKELVQLRQVEKESLQNTAEALAEEDQGQQTTLGEHEKLVQQLSLVQTRADTLQAQLREVTDEARTNREHSRKKEAERIVAENNNQSQKTRIADLENQLQTARFEIECAQTEMTAKQQLFQTNLDISSQIRTLRTELNTARTKLTSKDHDISKSVDLERRIESLQSQLESSRRVITAKDQQMLEHVRAHELLEQRLNTSQGRVDGLEGSVTALRQQLAEAHRDSAKVQTAVERCEQDLEDANNCLRDARAEADRRVLDVEKKLSKMKEQKLEVENKFRELQSQRDDLIEGHEAMLEDVRDRAEDAVRKAGALLEQERSEKKRLVKDLKRSKEELAKLQNEAAQRITEEESSDDDSSTSTATKEKDTEITNLRAIIKKQLAESKTLKAECTTLKKENKALKSSSETSSNLQSTITTLERQIITLHNENRDLQSRLEAQQLDFEAVNKAMDEQLATMLSKVMKEKAKMVVGKRDGQWAETVDRVQSEKELLGKVLMRQWGREEVGVADEEHEERQGYAYKYVKRA